ncbi:phosphonoacetaldehyde reductase [Amycolatopsis anabasis]|uniref:phosphonoacetaldehyde reductase n=1 Tax=Amycolatopsis anabasis TaxID=1840409 RepID=UPI00131D3C13|nr:phosphonoacetaldehyde reductase [Amycolatopsis anabasis]
MSVSCPSSALGEVWFGRGRLDDLPGYLARRAVTSCLLVTGGRSFQDSGAEARLDRVLHGIRVVHRGGVPPNPPAEYVAEGVGVLRRSAVDAVIAVGGGSVLDAGKLIAGLAAQPGPPGDYLVVRRSLLVPARRATLVLVPTTGGSGSEATSIAVVTVRGRKTSLQHEVLRADLSVVDPELSWAAPPALTASCGLDALSHAVESYWSVAATETSRSRAATAIPLAARNLVAASTAPSPDARAAMSRAALFAGQAIEATQTTAAHALSYAMTTTYGVPHGHACALFLGAFLEYNAGVTDADVADERGAEFVRARIREVLSLLGVASAADGRALVEGMLRRTGLGHRLSAFGVRARDLADLADAGLRSPRIANNPRRVGRNTLLGLLSGLL